LSYLLGVDIGGSKADFLLTSADGLEMSCLTIPSKNLTNPDTNTVDLLLSKGLDQLSSSVDLTEISNICLGVAGLHTGNRVQLIGLIGQSISKYTSAKVQVVNDAVIGFHALLGHRQGIALIAGTGSLAARIHEDLVIKTAGGTGAKFGDKGSAFWIGKKAIQHILEGSDLGATEPELLKEFGIHSADSESSKWELVQYFNGMSNSEVAALSINVAHWSDTLPWAMNILSNAASNLISLAEHLNPRNEPVALIGSLFSKNTFIREKVSSGLLEMGLSPEIVNRPVEGAIKLARLSL